uniref:homogentisate 1,2-dioxygenase n=1 Tax=Bionectria ochroleuca TaxID=29856 RepID=A0A8H7NF98_BIOOC
MTSCIMKTMNANKQVRSEAVEGSLPIGMNSPQKPPYGLYAEKLSGTAFTAPRHENKQTWLYRILPSCAHPPYGPATTGVNPDGVNQWGKDEKLHYIPNQLRWDPFDHDSSKHLDFVTGLRLVAGAGDPVLKQGIGMFVFAAGKSMEKTSSFYSADGDLLIVAQEGDLDIRTEFGWILVRPMEICVIPRGVKYQVFLPSGPARGYALELYQGHFVLPELGPIGSNGLANARDFQSPVACFDEDCGSLASEGSVQHTVTVKFNNALFDTKQAHTPFDVVAWHGNYYPYKYDLGRFNTIGTISYDHPDPSIFTVLSAPSPWRARPSPTSSSSPALARRRGHLPPALLPPQHHERVHGPDTGRLRRQARRLGRVRSWRGEPSQRHERARPRRGEQRGRARGPAAAGQGRRGQLRLHVRELPDDGRDGVGAEHLQEGAGGLQRGELGGVKTHWARPADRQVRSHLV